MKAKLILFSIIFLANFSFSGVKDFLPCSVDAVSENQRLTESYEGYRIERVFFDGKWWIIVYDTDGNIVNIYEDEE